MNLLKLMMVGVALASGSANADEVPARYECTLRRFDKGMHVEIKKFVLTDEHAQVRMDNVRALAQRLRNRNRMGIYAGIFADDGENTALRAGAGAHTFDHIGQLTVSLVDPAISHTLSCALLDK